MIDVHAHPGAGGSNTSALLPKLLDDTTLRHEPRAPPTGSRSLARALGLKINRIAIDTGHGGSDTGAMGPHGLLEKDLCLDVAMRLGQLIESNISGAEVVYTRKDDSSSRSSAAPTLPTTPTPTCLFRSTPIPATSTTCAASKPTILNLLSSPESMQLATRENALRRRGAPRSSQSAPETRAQ